MRTGTIPRRRSCVVEMAPNRHGAGRLRDDRGRTYQAVDLKAALDAGDRVTARLVPVGARGNAWRVDDLTVIDAATDRSHGTPAAIDSTASEASERTYPGTDPARPKTEGLNGR